MAISETRKRADAGQGPASRTLDRTGPPANVYVVSEFYRSFRLDRFIQAMIPKLSRAKIQEAIRTRVTVSWHASPRPSLTVVPGGRVAVHFPEIVEPEVPDPPRVLYEDEAILVADKPPGLLVHPTHSCRLNSLIHIMKRDRPGVPLALAHRLDRDTSGVILLTKSTDAARFIAAQFERRTVEKHYLAVVHGRTPGPAGCIEAPLGVAQRLQVVFKRSSDGRNAQRAVTHYHVLAGSDTISFLLLRPRTGRRHQLRAHLAGLGHPIVGDKLYGLSDREYLAHVRHPLSEEDARSRLLADRQLLHAWRLRFIHPATRAPFEAESPIPKDMLDLLAAKGINPTYQKTIAGS